MGSRELEGVKGVLRETLKPNLSGNSAKRRFRRVLLPTPDGPDRTRGRRKLAAAMETNKRGSKKGYSVTGHRQVVTENNSALPIPDSSP